MKQTKSRTAKTEVKCDHCGKTFQITVYPLLSIDEYPKLKSKLIDTSFFTPYCPNCHKRVRVPYSMTYSDPKNSLIVCMYCDEKEYQEALKMHEGSDLYGMMMNYVNQNGEVRIVRTPVELAEKICIKDAHLSDETMELMKFHLLIQLKERFPAADRIYFLMRGKEQYLLVVDKEDKLYEIPYEQGWYEEAARAYGSLVKSIQKKPVVVDQTWAKNLLQPIAFDEKKNAVGLE